MKKALLIALAAMLSVIVKAQDCKNAYYFSEGTTVETKTTLADGSFKERKIAKISSVQTTGTGASSVITAVKYDKKDKASEPETAKIKCDGNGLKISFQMPVLDDEDAQPKELFLSYPTVMKPGQQLETQVELNIKGEVKGKKMDVNFKVTNRRVIGPERINTPMGSKDCVKIGFDMEVKFKIMGIKIPMKLKILEWYAPGYGILKTEAYQGDKLSEISIVTIKK